MTHDLACVCKGYCPDGGDCAPIIGPNPCACQCVPKHQDTHDPMCPYGGFLSEPDDCDIWPGAPSVCDLIRNVRAEEHAYIISVIEELPCRCESGADYCDGHTDAINAIEALDPRTR